MTWQAILPILGERGLMHRAESESNHVPDHGRVFFPFGGGRPGGRLPLGQSSLFGYVVSNFSLNGRLDSDQDAS